MENLDNPSVVASILVQTLSWRERKAKFISKAEDGILQAVSQILLPLIGASLLSLI